MSERDLQRPAINAKAPRVRHLVMDDQHWVVHELAAPSFDRRGGMHLLFESEGVIRRLRSFPVDWYELPDEQLYALTDRIRL